MGKADAMAQGYGEKFPGLEALFAMNPTEEYLRDAKLPLSVLHRYKKNIAFLSNITSSEAIGKSRFHVLKEYVIELSDVMQNYNGVNKDKKIIPILSVKDKFIIRNDICNTVDDVYRAEQIEKFTEHDTAAAGDYLKFCIAKALPHLEEFMDVVHFGNTSEDVMSPVFGMMANNLIYRAFIPKILDFNKSMINYVNRIEKDGPLIIPGLTHQQAAEPNTLAIKIITRIDAIDYLISQMMDKTLDEKTNKLVENFIPFSGKFGSAINNLTTHYAAYPDINWQEFAKKHIENFGLKYTAMADQCSTYVVDAQHFTTVANMLTEVLKLTTDFVDFAATPAQFFVKTKKAGTKGSSIMPNKSNAWGQEGAQKMLKLARHNLMFYAEELPTYMHEGDMGRSFLMRNLADVFVPTFIALDRIADEINKYEPNRPNIEAFFNMYPGMAGSTIQTLLKRDRVPGDAYRIIERIAINPDSTYANQKQFAEGLEGAMIEMNLSESFKNELRGTMDSVKLTAKAHERAKEREKVLLERFASYRTKLPGTYVLPVATK